MYTVINQIIKSEFLTNDLAHKRVYIVLYETLKRVIESGTIPEGSVMPPTRLLAEFIDLSRSTVVKAYSLLAENHLITPKAGSGYIVASLPKQNTKSSEGTAVYPEISDIGNAYLQNIHLLNNTKIEGVAFTPGLPPLDIFPISQWQKLTNLYWRNIKASDLNYSMSSGLDTLKHSIANYLLLSRRIKCDPAQILVVSGSLQSLYLIGNVLINEGDGVYLENPTFPNVISIFKSIRANVMPVGVDQEGIKIDELGQNAAKLVHVTPSNQYPIGGKMSLERRLALIKWANENNALIIENDYEHEINNWHQPIDSIFSLDDQQRTIYLGTFNRILHPSIRLGYMIVPPHLLPAIKALQMHSHRFVPQSIQVVMTDFIGQNLIYKHLRNVIAEAEERKELFISLFNKKFDDQIKIKENPTSSFHLLAELMDPDANDEKLVSALEAKGIVTHPESKCYLDESRKQGLILGYSCINKSFMSQFLVKMAGVYHGKGWVN